MDYRSVLRVAVSPKYGSTLMDRYSGILALVLATILVLGLLIFAPSSPYLPELLAAVASVLMGFLTHSGHMEAQTSISPVAVPPVSPLPPSG